MTDDGMTVPHPSEGGEAAVGTAPGALTATDVLGRDEDAPGTEDVAARPRSARARSAPPRRSFARELPFLVLVAFVLAIIIKTFLIQAFWIPSGSMERTLLINDRVLVNKVVYDFRGVHRGEVVVFNGDGTGFQRLEETGNAVTAPPNVIARLLRDVQALAGLGAPSDKDFIKRVIGIGGDTVACCDAQGRVTVNGHALDEPYIYQNSQIGIPDGRNFGPVKVPSGDVWVMGDHRSASSDSRVNGPVPESKIVGRAFVRVWPPTRFAFLRVPSAFQSPLALLGAPNLLAGLCVFPVGLMRWRRRKGFRSLERHASPRQRR